MMQVCPGYANPCCLYVTGWLMLPVTSCQESSPCSLCNRSVKSSLSSHYTSEDVTVGLLPCMPVRFIRYVLWYSSCGSFALPSEFPPYSGWPIGNLTSLVSSVPFYVTLWGTGQSDPLSVPVCFLVVPYFGATGSYNMRVYTIVEPFILAHNQFPSYSY